MQRDACWTWNAALTWSATVPGDGWRRRNGPVAPRPAAASSMMCRTQSALSKRRPQGSWWVTSSLPCPYCPCKLEQFGFQGNVSRFSGASCHLIFDYSTRAAGMFGREGCGEPESSRPPFPPRPAVPVPREFQGVWLDIAGFIASVSIWLRNWT